MARHKIDGKGKVSKGLRISCKHVRKEHPAQPVVFLNYETRMREAFRESLVKPDINRHVGRIVVNAQAKHPNSGLIKLGKGWNASLSMRTYQELRVRCGL